MEGMITTEVFSSTQVVRWLIYIRRGVALHGRGGHALTHTTFLCHSMMFIIITLQVWGLQLDKFKPSSWSLSEAKRKCKKAARSLCKLRREIKVHTSSKLEGCLLYATQPNDEAVNEKHMKPIFDTMLHFAPIRARHGIEPSKVLISKLYKKCSREDDWRSASKAFYIIHRLLRECSPQDSHTLAREFRSVSYKSLTPGNAISLYVYVYSGVPLLSLLIHIHFYPEPQQQVAEA